MKKSYFNKKRSGALLLSVAMVLTMPGSVLGASGQGMPGDGLCEHHQEHNEVCGYRPEKIEAACVHQHDSTCYEENEAASSSEAANLNCSHQCEQNCGTVVVDPGQDCSYQCQLCKEELQHGQSQENQDSQPSTASPSDADRKEEKDQEQQDRQPSTASPSDADRKEENLRIGRILSWEWVGLEKGKLVLNVKEGEQLTVDEVVSQLPEQILATIRPYEEVDESEASPSNARRARLRLSEDEEEVTLDVLEWNSESFPQEGAVDGQYVFRATLPEGYSLFGSAKSLSLLVEIRTSSVVAMIGQDSYESLGAAFRAAQAGDTIVMQADAQEQLRLGSVSGVSGGSVSDLISIRRDLTLDLNGYTLSGIDSYPLGLYNVDGFTITDGATETESEADKSEEGGEPDWVTDASKTGEITGDRGTSAVYAMDTEGLVIEGGNLNGSKRGLELSGTECTIIDGTFEGSSYGVYVGRESQLTVEGGAFEGSGSGSDRAGLFVTKNCESVALSGGTFKGAEASVRTAGFGTMLDLLSDGYGYLDDQNQVITDQSVLLGSAITENVTVGEAEIDIIPGEVEVEVSADHVTYGYSRQPVLKAFAVGGQNYKWYEEMDGQAKLVSTESNYTFPTGRSAGDYVFYCEAEVDGEIKRSEKLTITVEKAATSINNRSYDLMYDYNGDPVPDPEGDFMATSNAPLSFIWYEESLSGNQLQERPSRSGTYVLLVKAEETENYLGAEESWTITIRAKTDSGNTGGGSGSSGGSGGGSSSVGSSAHTGPTADPGIISIDSRKGYVNSVTGIITGNPGEGYSHWVSDLVGWRLYYPDGTYAAGNITQMADGQTIETIQWEKVNGTWWAFGADGYTETGWIHDQGQWYWQDANIGMFTGWHLIQGKWYYFETVGTNKLTGAMYHNEYTPDGYWVDASGIWDGKTREQS